MKTNGVSKRQATSAISARWVGSAIGWNEVQRGKMASWPPEWMSSTTPTLGKMLVLTKWAMRNQNHSPIHFGWIKIAAEVLHRHLPFPFVPVRAAEDGHTRQPPPLTGIS